MDPFSPQGFADHNTPGDQEHPKMPANQASETPPENQSGPNLDAGRTHTPPDRYLEGIYSTVFPSAVVARLLEVHRALDRQIETAEFACATISLLEGEWLRFHRVIEEIVELLIALREAAAEQGVNVNRGREGESNNHGGSRENSDGDLVWNLA
ncbi:hypothetical protein TWF506_001871 [Arthrobotrys conoides]|uniref:Uncharacterized protein n=1 Tax=Arthrobotrys conoides TaxID=74498 RepID=A0AAN8P082_9PEZI